MNSEQLKQQDGFVYAEMFEWNVYQTRPEELLNANIIDVGGHYGMFDIYCNTFKPKRIITIEANPNNFLLLLQNTKDIDNLKAVNMAVAAKTGDIVTIEDNGCQSQIGKGELKVSTVSLADVTSWIPNNEDIVLKMDIEGAEYDVLLNTPPSVYKRFKYIYVELHEIDEVKNTNMLNKFIQNLGFYCLWEGHFFTGSETNKILNQKIKIFKYLRM